MPHLCRHCGKPIRKRTIIVYVREHPTEYDRVGRLFRYVYGKPRSIQDCTPMTERQIVSVSYDKSGVIDRFTEWDGESYVDPFFCTNRCAIAFAKLMAREGHETVAYRNCLSKTLEPSK